MIRKIFDTFDFDDACLLFYFLVNKRIPGVGEKEYYMYIQQFVREEFDAAYKLGGYAKNFVESTCKEGVEWFEGALYEDSQYKIDEAEGPQQFLHALAFELGTTDQYTAQKALCEVVRIFYEDLRLFLDNPARMPIPLKSTLGTYLYNRRKRHDRLQEILQSLASNPIL